jgi:hypothetical protein
MLSRAASLLAHDVYVTCALITHCLSLSFRIT